ncbi:MAG: hypothetical protein M3220_13195 [Chloroflexota bacterium]|nr:hypothetical protein [Chloroflexota bacterium]
MVNYLFCCAKKGVRALVVVTADLVEPVTEEGVAWQQLTETVRGYGMRLVGPRSMGLLNTDPNVQLNASLAPILPPAGPVAMASQSGSLGLVVLSLARQWGLGLSTFVSLGDKADVSGNDLLQQREGDERTGVILLYLESFGNPRRFARLARLVGRRKPVVVVKSGRTSVGENVTESFLPLFSSSEVLWRRSSSRLASFGPRPLTRCFTWPSSSASSPCRGVDEWPS